MAKISIEIPEITTVSYRQEREDSDYGSCLWARFNFDTKNYSLSIESDCGSYSYGWCPTPDHETFLHLCSRFDQFYLLDKIANRSVVNGDATFKSLMAMLKEYDDYGFAMLSDAQIQIIEESCHGNRNDHAAFDEINKALDGTVFDGSCSEYDIACCIEMDYPRGARKIADVFKTYIQPEIRKLTGYKPKEEG